MQIRIMMKKLKKYLTVNNYNITLGGTNSVKNSSESNYGILRKSSSEKSVEDNKNASRNVESIVLNPGKRLPANKKDPDTILNVLENKKR
jgi:hypothetical protein